MFGSGKAAFRFLIPREAALADPVTRSIGEIQNGLVSWYGSSRRIVTYPCNNNELFNFVCIHPDSESHATQSDGKLGIDYRQRYNHFLANAAQNGTKKGT